jgi:hypothetical protein
MTIRELKKRALAILADKNSSDAARREARKLLSEAKLHEAFGPGISHDAARALARMTPPSPEIAIAQTLTRQSASLAGRR